MGSVFKRTFGEERSEVSGRQVTRWYVRVKVGLRWVPDLDPKTREELSTGRFEGGRWTKELAGSSKAQAELWLSRREAEEVERARFPELAKAKREEAKLELRAGRTVADLESLWLEHAQVKRSVRDDASRFKVIREWFGESRPLGEITTDEVLRFREFLSRQPYQRAKQAPPPLPPGKKHPGPKPKPRPESRTLSQSTINRYVVLLKSAMRRARQAGYMQNDPCAGVKLFAEHARDRLCMPDEFAALIAAAQPELRLVIIVAHETGMRLGEIIGLRWEQIDLKRGLIKLGSGDTKTGEGRKVPLSAMTVEALRGWPRALDGGRLFPDLKRGTVSPTFAKLTKKLGIAGLHFHDLRHTALTRMRRNGTDLMVIAAISGHKSLETLKKYQTVSEDELIAAVAPAKPKAKR